MLKVVQGTVFNIKFGLGGPVLGGTVFTVTYLLDIQDRVYCLRGIRRGVSSIITALFACGESEPSLLEKRLNRIGFRKWCC